MRRCPCGAHAAVAGPDGGEGWAHEHHGVHRVPNPDAEHNPAQPRPAEQGRAGTETGTLINFSRRGPVAPKCQGNRHPADLCMVA